jgi:DNA-binding MarR family transcriptional regulator
MTESTVPFATTIQVRDSCLCLHTQRAARVLARRFDAVLRPAGLTNEQYSLLMSLNRPQPPQMKEVAALLGADRTTLTAAFKPLVRQGLVDIQPDAEDARVRRAALTRQGQKRLAAALPLWTAAHAALEQEHAEVDPARLRRDLTSLSATPANAPAPTLCDN